MSGEMPLVPTSAGEYRKKRGSFLVAIHEDLTVRMRRLDMPSLLMEGIIPLEMLKAAQHFAELQAKVDGATDDMEVIEAIDQRDRDKFLTFLRRYACIAILEPKIVDYVPREDEDAIYVQELTTLELLAIWNANPPGGEPLVKPEAAQEFRGTESEHDSSHVPAGEDVRPEAELVVVQPGKTEDDTRTGIRA